MKLVSLSFLLFVSLILLCKRTSGDVIIQCNSTLLDEATAVDTNNTVSNKTSALIKQLYNWCIADSHCSDLFYQNDVNNITIFKYMVESIIETENYLHKPFQLICGDDGTVSDNDILKNLWLLTLMSRKYEQNICDINHILLFDRNTVTSKCVCKPNKLCSDEGNNLSGIYAILIINLIILLLNVLAIKYKITTLMEILKKSYGKSHVKTMLSRII